MRGQTDCFGACGARSVYGIFTWSFDFPSRDAILRFTVDQSVDFGRDVSPFGREVSVGRVVHVLHARNDVQYARRVHRLHGRRESVAGHICV